MDLIYEHNQVPVYKVISGPHLEDEDHKLPWLRIRQLSGIVPRGQVRGVEVDVAISVMTIWKTREELVAEKLM
jgi:hypothetical protein